MAADDGVLSAKRVVAAIHEYASNYKIDGKIISDAVLLNFGTLKAIPAAIEQLCAVLIPLAKAGKADRVIGFLITRMLAQCASFGLVPPEALVTLASIRLDADEYGDEHFRHGVDIAFNRAVIFKIADPKISNSKLARCTGISRPEIIKWIKSGDLGRAVTALLAALESETGMPARAAAYLLAKLPQA